MSRAIQLNFLLAAAAAALAAGCAGSADQPVSVGYGRSPDLPKPQTALIPAVNVAEATGWASGETPRAADGLEVVAFADGLSHPRWLYVLPNGDVLVAENGQVAEGYVEADAAAHMKGEDVTVSVDLGLGDGFITVFTCDLTAQYIAINADYRS